MVTRASILFSFLFTSKFVQKTTFFQGLPKSRDEYTIMIAKGYLFFMRRKGYKRSYSDGFYVKAKKCSNGQLSK